MYFKINYKILVFVFCVVNASDFGVHIQKQTENEALESENHETHDKEVYERAIGSTWAHKHPHTFGYIDYTDSSLWGHSGYERIRACDVFLWQGEGNITSYDYPFNYPDSIECSYTIPRVDFSSCALELTFYDFDVSTDGSRCNQDYLEVGSKRYCGRLSQTTEIVDFPYNKPALTFTFKSDDIDSGRGFLIEVRRIYRSCYQLSVPVLPDMNIDTIQGRLTSYAYPDNYKENMNCTYFIERQQGFCSVELEFIDFDVEDSSGCSQDYIIVEGVRYCGNTLYGRKMSLNFRERSELALVFVANNRGRNRGFDIRYTQVACSREEPRGRVIDYKPAKPSKINCDREFSSRDIYLTSYNYPSFYESEMDCVYTIRRFSNDVCELEFTFMNFDLEYDRLCRGDYLDVNGGKLCGTLPTKSNRRVRFYGSEILVKFHSDDTVNRKGFEIHVTQKTDCSTSAPTRIIQTQSYCDEEYSAKEFYLQSVNYPHYYSNYMDCAYVIRKFSPDVCDLQLIFLSFDLQDDPTCSYDYLEIDGTKLCGNVEHGNIRRIPFDKQEILIRFHSDRASSGRGFQIFAQQRRDCPRGYSVHLTSNVLVPAPPPPPPSCDETYTSNEFRIRSLHYPGDYENNMLCTLRILRMSTRVCQLELVFNTFDLEQDVGCRYDYLEVGGQRLCGFIRQGTIRKVRFDLQEISLRFVTDHTNTRPGFDITVRQLSDCELPQLRYVVPPVKQVFVPPKLAIIPPQPPYSKGGPVISQPVYTKGTQYIAQTTYTKGTPVVAIPRTPIIAQPVVTQTYTKGTQQAIPRTTYTKGAPVIPQQVITPVVVQTGSRKGITSVISQNVNAQGFAKLVPQGYNKGTSRTAPQAPFVRAPFTYVTSVPSTSCDQVYSTWEFFFQSANFPLHYGDNVDCTYRAQRFSSSVCEIELHFMSFDTEAHPDCAKDYLEMEGERFCGNIAPGSIRRYKFDKPEFIIHFHSDHEMSGLGFNVLVRQKTQCPADTLIPTQISTETEFVPPPIRQVTVPSAHIMPTTVEVPIYDFQLTQPSSQFTSLNYPGDYGHGINCTYRISRAKDVCAVELYFYDFDLESSPACQSDYLAFGGKRYCGNELKGQTRMLYFEHSSEAVLNFVSNGEISDKGWWTFYRQVPCAEVTHSNLEVAPELCGQTFMEETGFIKSRNYPLSQYPSNEDCFYRIKRVRNDICALELVFTDFSLESSTNCANDYLEIDRRRYCGNDLLRKTVYLNFPPGAEDILLHFKSNDNRESNGFFLQVRQLSYGCSRSTGFPAVALQYRTESNTCKEIHRSEQDSFQSPQYPSSYPPNSDCTFTVERSSRAVCGLELDFDHFALETSRLCLYDYLQTSMGDRLCGNSWTGVKRTVPFPAHEDQLIFVFHSDARIQDQGFHINYRQITTECP